MHKDKAKVKKICRSRKRFNKAYVNIFNMNFFKLTLSNLINFISTIYAAFKKKNLNGARLWEVGVFNNCYGDLKSYLDLHFPLR